jgi:hypothetical protein
MAFLDEARPNIDHLHLVAQPLAGDALAGNGSSGAPQADDELANAD